MIDAFILAATHILAFMAGVYAHRTAEDLRNQKASEDIEDAESDYEKRNRLAIKALKKRSVLVFAKALQNHEETKIYRDLRQVIQDRNNFKENIKFSIHAQVGMAGILNIKGRKNANADQDVDRAYDGVFQKRFDLLIVDTFQNPVVAIEYQGEGHHRGNTSDAKDKMKRIACERARIPLIVVNQGETSPSYMKRVRDALDGHLEKPNK